MREAPAPLQISPVAYQSWRATRLGAITESLEQRVILKLMGPVKDADVLDAGCGDGALACAMASGGASVTGIDADPVMLAAARAHAEATRVEAMFLPGRIERLPFRDSSFDVVVAVTVLCFVADADTAVREMARVLRPGGRLVLGELGRRSVWAMSRRFRAWLGATTWKAAHFRTAAELRVLLQQAGLAVVTVCGAVFYPPIGLCAQALAPIDPWLGHRTTIGAAFIALGATSVSSTRSPGTEIRSMNRGPSPGRLPQ